MEIYTTQKQIKIDKKSKKQVIIYTILLNARQIFKTEDKDIFELANKKYLEEYKKRNGIK